MYAHTCLFACVTETNEHLTLEVFGVEPPPNLLYGISTICFLKNAKPNNFLKSSSILTLMSLNSAFKHVSLLHSDNYKERPNIQNKENFKLLKK